MALKKCRNMQEIVCLFYSYVSGCKVDLREIEFCITHGTNNTHNVCFKHVTSPL